jgi:hypothetical protein
MRLSILLAVLSALLVMAISAGASMGQELPTSADFQPPDAGCPPGSLPDPPPIDGDGESTTCSPVVDMRGSPLTGGVHDTSPPAGHFAQPEGDSEDPPPNPGNFIVGTFYKSGTLPATYSATFASYLEVYPWYVPEEFDTNTAGMYLTAGNRARHAVEFVATYYNSQHDFSPGYPAGIIQIFDWSCTPDYPCYNEAGEPKTSFSFVWDAWLPEVPCWYKMLEDNTGHYVNYLYYRNSTFTIGGDMRRNAVSIKNWCTNQYDGVYTHDFAAPTIQDPCSLPGATCTGNAGFVELFDFAPDPPEIVKQGFHHQTLYYDGQVSYLGPDVTTFANDSPWELYYLNPNSTWEVGTYQDDDGDDFPNSSDPDIDGDGSPNVVETICGAEAPPGKTAAWDPYVLEERLDNQFAGEDDDGDTLVDEPLPSGIGVFDCDGDGYSGSAEANVFTTASGRDQDPCGTDAWPADFVSGGIFESTNRVNIADFNSFLSPRRLDTSPGDPLFDIRWDISPGPGIFGDVINIADLNSLLTVTPPMLNGVRAWNGPTCPWPP